MEKTILTWDLGATKCAGALVAVNQSGDAFQCHRSCIIKLSSVSCLEELVLAIESNLNIRHHEVDLICIGAAGIFNGECLNLKNGYPYEMPLAQIAHRYNWPRFIVVHDYVPMLCATFCPQVKMQDVHPGVYQQDGNLLRRVVFGIGTGLGVKDGVAFPDGRLWLGNNEMGHIGISCPSTAPNNVQNIHQALLKTGLCTFEHVLSGQGLLRLHQLLHPHSSLNTSEDLGALMEQKLAEDTVGLFAFYLGLFTATVQLAFMPAGGVFIGGGVVLRNQAVFAREEFFLGIDSLPAYLEERRSFPIRVLWDPHAAFVGAAYYALRAKSSR